MEHPWTLEAVPPALPHPGAVAPPFIPDPMGPAPAHLVGLGSWCMLWEWDQLGSVPSSPEGLTCSLGGAPMRLRTLN